MISVSRKACFSWCLGPGHSCQALWMEEIGTRRRRATSVHVCPVLSLFICIPTYRNCTAVLFILCSIFVFCMLWCGFSYLINFEVVWLFLYNGDLFCSSLCLLWDDSKCHYALLITKTANNYWQNTPFFGFVSMVFKVFSTSVYTFEENLLFCYNHLIQFLVLKMWLCWYC